MNEQNGSSALIRVIWKKNDVSSTWSSKTDTVWMHKNKYNGLDCVQRAGVNKTPMLWIQLLSATEIWPLKDLNQCGWCAKVSFLLRFILNINNNTSPTVNIDTHSCNNSFFDFDIRVSNLHVWVVCKMWKLVRTKPLQLKWLSLRIEGSTPYFLPSRNQHHALNIKR